MLLKEPPSNFSVQAEVVAILPFFGEEVLLLQRLPTHPQANLWCPPGGKIHRNETIKEAAIRELFEETGITVEEHRLIDLGKYYVRYPNGDFIFHLYQTPITEQDTAIIRINTTEHQQFCLCPLTQIKDLALTPGLDECFELAVKGEDLNDPNTAMSKEQSVFHMICDEPWFSFIREGIKPVEGRKNSPKYQKIQPNDFIDFSNGKEHFLTIVTEIRSYASLEEYLDDVTFQKALPTVSSLGEAIEIYHQWNTPEEIQTHGLLGIFIKLMCVLFMLFFQSLFLYSHVLLHTYL